MPIKPLEFSARRVTKVSSVMIMRQLLEAPEDRPQVPGNQLWHQRAGTLSRTLLPSGKRRGEGLEVEPIVNGQWLNQS